MSVDTLPSQRVAQKILKKSISLYYIILLIVRVPGGGGRVALGTRLHLYTCSFYRSQPCHNPIPSYNITYYLYRARLFSVVAWFTFHHFISQYEQLAHSESQQLVNLQPRVDTQK